MNQLNFFQKREFGENISFSLQFFKQNFLHYFFSQYVLSLPIWIAMAFFFYMIGDNFRDFLYFLDYSGKTGTILLFYVVSIVIGCYFLCIGYNYHSLYIQKDKNKFGVQEILTETIRTYGRALISYVGLFFFFFVLTFIVALLLKPFGRDLSSFIFLGVFAYCFIYLAFTILITVYEKASIVTAAKRSIALVKDNWWKTFGVFVVIFILSYLLLYIANLVLFFILSMAAWSFRSFVDNLVSNKGVFIAGMIFLFSLSINIMGMLLNTTTFTLYGALVEEKEGVNLKDQAEKLGTTLDNEKDEEDF